MKIFSNFDTELPEKLLAEAADQYGDENVCLIRRDKIYLYLKIIFPLSMWLIGVVFILIFMYNIVKNDFFTITGWTVIIGSIAYLKRILGGKLIDYYLDFSIINPNQIIFYDQTGFFRRHTRALGISKIKSISVSKKGLLRSIFNYGSIVFFAEGDEKLGDIKLNYINDPLKLKNKINDIINNYHATTTPSQRREEVTNL